MMAMLEYYNTLFTTKSATVAATTTTFLSLITTLVWHMNNKRRSGRNDKEKDIISLQSNGAPTTNAAVAAAQDPFDKLADTYDSSFCDTSVGRLLRLQTWKDIDEAFATSACKTKEDFPVLEISCGTGVDAVHLATKHVHVVATDYSPGMLRKARQKCSSTPSIPQDCLPTFKELNLRDSHYDIALEPTQKFAGAYCNFGGLNNVSPEDIKHLAAELSELVYPGGKVVLVVMGRFCLFETLYYLLKGHFKRALRRLRGTQKGGVTARVAPKTNKQQVYFYSMSFLEETFNSTNAFVTIKKKAIGLTLPPSLWSRSSSKRMHPSLLTLLSWVDSLLSEHWLFRNLGDHFLIEFERVNDLPRCARMKRQSLLH